MAKYLRHGTRLMDTGVTAKISIFVFFAIIFIVSSGSNSIAVESSIIETDVDTSYLPYYFEFIDGNNWGATSEPVFHPIHTYHQMMDESSKGYYIRVSNRPLNDIRPATFSMIDVRESMKIVDDDPINLDVNDWSFYFDSLINAKIISGAGIRNDSAFAFRFNPEDENEPEFLYLQSMNYQDGETKRKLSVCLLLIEDYDYDGMQEGFYYVNTNDAKSPRTLYCIELEKFRVEWSLPVAIILDKGRLFSIKDSLNPGIIIHGYNPMNGLYDKNFDDHYSYMAIINTKGEIIKSFKIAEEFFDCRFIPSEQDGVYYLPHQFDINEPFDSLGYDNSHYFLSKIKTNGEIIKTISLLIKPHRIWLMPYQDKDNLSLCLQDKEYKLSIYDLNLELVAESEVPREFLFLGEIKLPSRDVNALFFRDGIYDLNLNKIMHLNQKCCTYFEPLAYKNNVTSISLGGTNCWSIGRIKKKPFTKLLAIFFINNKDYFLVAMTGSIVALFLVNFYRRRTRSNLDLIKNQKTQLERTHQALKEAQATIIEQEKYKQAKDIAGGFAHEIRNALYPVDIILTKLMLSEKISSIDEAKLRDYMKDIGSSIGKAVDLTELISQYTKLDSEYMPTKISLIYLIKEVLKANRLLIENSGIEIEFDESSNISVLGNHKQMSIVINNILLNSIDALKGQDNPKIFIKIIQSTDYCELIFIDNGIGIESDKINRIFDTFYSTKPDKGKGIGLSMSKKIIEMYGGTITVDSTLNVGTTFVIRLKKDSK